ISGSETGADGQSVRVTIVNAGGQVVDSYTTTAANGTWSVSVTSTQALALADGSYPAAASLSDAAGNPARSMTTLNVDETAPAISIATIARENVVLLPYAKVVRAISGSETGADGQNVTVTIVNAAGQVVDSYTTTAANGAWSVSVTSTQALAL